MLQFAFERASFRVYTAGNGQEALEMAEIHRPDIILMDLMMPVMDGRRATAELKAKPAVAHIPVVLYTAYHQATLSEEALQAGAAAVIAKTTTPKMLVAQINDLLTAYKSGG